jgi:hypothetical protein
MLSKTKIDRDVAAAIAMYWSTRDNQQSLQGSDGQKDAGFRTAVTGGKQLDGFCKLVSDILHGAGLGRHEVFSGRGKGVLPGYYRPNKDWDVVAVADNAKGQRVLVACVEIKSHAGPSFGNNFNNRVEEALGNSTDFWKAYEKRLIPTHPRPFLGYIMVLEKAKGSTTGVRADAPHFAVDSCFYDASYLHRYRVMCDRLMRERLYDATALIAAARDGEYEEPLDTATTWTFASTLSATAMVFAAERKG